MTRKQITCGRRATMNDALAITIKPSTAGSGTSLPMATPLPVLFALCRQIT